MIKKYISIVPFWPLPLKKEENYFIFPALCAKKAGYVINFFVLNKELRKTATDKSMRITFFSSAWRIYKEISIGSVAHVHSGVRYIILLLGMLSIRKSGNVKIIWTPHMSFGLNNGNPYSFPVDLFRLFKPFFVRLHKIITITPYEHRHLLDLGYANVKYLPLTLNSYVFKNIAHEKRDKYFHLLFVGGDRPVKGLENTLVALSILNKKNVPCRLDVLGEVSDEFIKKHKKLITKNIVMHGQLNHVSRPFLNVFQNADCYINSSFSEGSPVAAYEAVASKLPLILSDLPTLRSIFKSNALYHAPTNPQELAENISFFYNNPSVQKKHVTSNLKLFKKNSPAYFFSQFTAILNL